MFARLHQIEPFAVNILKVGIASGSHASSTARHRSSGRKRWLWRRPTQKICWAGRRARRRARRREGRRVGRGENCRVGRRESRR
eukprot:1958461-Pyramimonas_sp.AAC.1